MGIYHLGLISPENNANTKLNGLKPKYFSISYKNLEEGSPGLV